MPHANGDSERAVELLERGAPRIAAAGRPFEEASFRLEQARALAAIGRKEDAAALLMALSPSFAEGRPIDSGRTYALLAEAWEEIGEEERASETYELALEQFADVQTPSAVDVFSRLAALHERRGNKDAAFELLKQAMPLQQALRAPQTAASPTYSTQGQTVGAVCGAACPGGTHAGTPSLAATGQLLSRYGSTAQNANRPKPPPHDSDCL